MQSSTRAKTLTASITAKVTSDEETLFKSKAQAAGLSLSEWTRTMLVSAATFSPDTRFLLAEFMALRGVILSLQRDNFNGVALTEPRIKETIDLIETRKYAMADSRIQSAQTSQTGEKK